MQIIQLKSTAGNIAAWRHTWREEFRGLFTIKRVIIALVVFYLIGYIWVYQVLQDKVTALLVAEEIDGVTVGSLVMPYTAFFRSEYIADTGFSRSRKRTRADVSVTGHLWSGPRFAHFRN